MSYNQKIYIYIFILQHLNASFKKVFYYWLNREEINQDYQKLRTSFLGYFFRVYFCGLIFNITHNHISIHMFFLRTG